MSLLCKLKKLVHQGILKEEDLDRIVIIPKGQIPDLKETYNKGYKDGQEALAFHLELCKEEGSIITVPDGATNGDMAKLVFPDVAIDIHFRMLDDWWNSPYRKEQE